MSPQSICFAASEMTPFAKTGGLADVAGALPLHLEAQGHDVRVFMPLYAQVDTSKHYFVRVDYLCEVPVHLGPHTFSFSASVAQAPGSEVDVYFIDCPELFHRSELYTGERDDHLRFALFCRAVIECCQRMGWSPDVFHLNDWHTALVPLFLKTLYSWDRLFGRSKTVLTIHNIAFQGIFPADTIVNLGLADHRHLFHQEDLAAGTVNLLRTGLLYADAITTVSPTYAREIRTAAFGEGLDPLLRQRSGAVTGIVNGIDDSLWSPESDPYIPRRYGIDDVAEGKAKNREHLLDAVGLSHGEGSPALGIVSRLTAQKGFDLVFEPLTQALGHLDLRLVVLGTGKSEVEERFARLQQSFPQKVCYYRGYSEELAHLIEAACDIFLMPSRFEPCGLNQMYSLKYGTVPIVRQTGGLADTVELWDPESGTGTGFVFDHFDVPGFAWALDTALATFEDRTAWERLRRNGMEKDYSWEHQGAEYEKLYRALTE